MHRTSSHAERSTPTVFPWYLPTFHGDIKLESQDPATTNLRAYELTPTEERAMTLLRERALKKSALVSSWVEDPKNFPLPSSGPYRTKKGVEILLRAPIAKVQAVLVKALKPDRKLVHAVRFSDGRMEEIRKTIVDTEDDETLVVPPKATKAVSVAAPTVGCPVPDFPESEIRATRVLEEFLTAEQLQDYRRYGRFVARGADSGHQYAITHRERRSSMVLVSLRSLYDLTEKIALCVHDWTVPPPEEMLGLLVCISLPGNEARVRALPEVYA
jgi:hypothetical protein